MIKIKVSVGKDIFNIKKVIKPQIKKKIEQYKDALAAATPVDTGRARDSWRVEGDTIVNDVEYISKLNSGSSQQAPEYFIEKTLLAQQGVSPNGVIVTER